MKSAVSVALLVSLASPALAGSWETKCQTETVAYQQKVKGAKPEQVLGGALIGGVIGKAATGKDSGAVVGAIIGGAVANENGNKTVTKYKDVETCRQIYTPSYINDEDGLRETILNLNDGGHESKERIMDVQFTIGVTHDGSWGPQSQRASRDYLDGAPVQAVVEEAKAPLYSLIVNDVVVVTSPDVNAIDDIQKSLLQAGVESKIFVNMQ